MVKVAITQKSNKKGGLIKKLNIKSLKQKINTTMKNRKIESDINKEIYRLVEDWGDIMFELNYKTSYGGTYTLINIKKTSYGYHCNIYATKGLNLSELEKAKPFIETGIGCIFLFYIKRKGSKTAEAKFVIEGFGGSDMEFMPPKTTQFELCIGNSIEGSPVIISAKDVSHFLLSGSNGGGKSRLLDILITTLIHNCDETELELYLGQIAKTDLVVYEDALCCRAFCETLNEVETMLIHISEKMVARSKLIKPMHKDFLGSDIYDYNKLHPNNKMTVCWVIFDEISSIMETTGNDRDIAKQKNRIIAMIEEIAKVGRALGVFLGVCLQRCTVNMLSPLVKSQTNLRISFAQNNIKSSEVATDDPNIAIGLDDRVAVYSCRARGFDFIKTPYIDDQVIKKYILSKSKRGHRNLFADLKKLKTIPEIQFTNPIDNVLDFKSKQNVGTAPRPTSKGNNPIKPPVEEEIIVNPNIKDSPPTSIAIINTEPETIINVETKDIITVKPKFTQQVKPSISLEFDNVDPNNKNVSKNIKLIPNFVPYNPVLPKLDNKEDINDL